MDLLDALNKQGLLYFIISQLTIVMKFLSRIKQFQL